MKHLKSSFQSLIEWITASTIRKWVTASTISWTLAAVFGAVCRVLAWNNLNINVGLSMVITITALLVFGGVSTSLTQWKILRSTTDEIGHWGKASIKGWALGAMAGTVIIAIAIFILAMTIAVVIPGSGEGSSWARPLAFGIFALPIAVALGALGSIYFVGLFQSKILNQLVHRNSHWTRTSIKSGIIGLFVVLCAMMVLRTRASSIAVSGVLGGIYGMTTGIITGTRLTSLLPLEAEKDEAAHN